MTSESPEGAVLVVNAGSSSIKAAVFDAALAPLAEIRAEGIGEDARIVSQGAATRRDLPDHDTALAAILDALSHAGFGLMSLRAAAHRIVHGGETLNRPARITPEIRAAIAGAATLAPLHNPHALSAIDALARMAPELPQCACFDTGFHATNPEVARRYALPQGPETADIRRYGFHGLSYAALCRTLPEISEAALPGRLLACHLGNGASLCAIRDGRSLATTMGYSPLEGLTMGTRSGSIDPNAVLDLAQSLGLDRTRRLLNAESGLLGLSGGLSDMRALLADPAPESAFAVEHFCYWALRHAGGLIAAMGGCDAVAFTGGIGEHAAPVRARILDGLSWLDLQVDVEANDRHGPALHAAGSRVTAWCVPADEERQIARDALDLMAEAG